MEFLHSNFPPVRPGGRSFTDAFYDMLPGTDSLDIAVGYITSDSLIELERLTELNNLRNVNLTIGMHYLDRFTHTQYNAAIRLNRYLTDNGRGQVRLVTPFRYHGKLYSYSDGEGPMAGIIGSNNLGSIVEGGSRVYESAVLIRDRVSAREMKSFIDLLVQEATDNIADLDIQQFNTTNTLLEEHENVQRVPPQRLAECMASLTPITFEIPIKGAEVSPQSNLNVFFGRGRVGHNGLVKPRHWYEVELIVPKPVATQAGYPRSRTPEAEFQVITDDGWTFRCKISGDYNKNFRSEGDLKILGKWLKGRLENAGALAVGSPVTNDTLRQYGRNTFMGMPDLAKVIKGLECCGLQGQETSYKCGDCPYQPNRFDKIRRDCKCHCDELFNDLTNALTTQKPVKPAQAYIKLTSKVETTFEYTCGYCAGYILQTWKACPICGKGIAWDEVSHN